MVALRASSSTSTPPALRLVPPAAEPVSLWSADDVAEPEEGQMSAMDAFVARFARIRLLSREQETRLALRMRAGDAAAKERLFNANLRWVYKLAAWQAGRVGGPLADFVQEAALGLWQRMEQYDPTRGRFSTWSHAWIRQAVQRATHDLMSPIHVPEHAVQAMRRYTRLVDAYLDAEVTPPPALMLAAEIGANPEVLAAAERARPRVVSLDAPVVRQDSHYVDQDTTLADFLASEDPEDGQEEVGIRGDASARLARFCTEVLSTRECEVIGLRYGHALTLEQAGVYLHITRERVRQIEAAAMVKLRQAASRAGIAELLAVYD